MKIREADGRENVPTLFLLTLTDGGAKAKTAGRRARARMNFMFSVVGLFDCLLYEKGDAMAMLNTQGLSRRWF